MMKNIRVILCTLLFVLCPFVASQAIDLPKQGLGLQIGWAQPILRLNTPDNPSTAKDSLSRKVALKGFKVGVVYDASFIAGFGSSIGINYTFAATKSGWQSVNPQYDYPRSRQLITYHEAEVFVDWQYKFEVAKETYLMLYTGPTIQCGIGMDMRVDTKDFDGNITYYHFDGYVVDEDNTSLQKENEHFKRINVTWGVGAGFQYKQFFVRGGYDFGLINPYANSQFVDKSGEKMDRYTRGRLDQWNVKIGMYLWYHE